MPHLKCTYKLLKALGLPQAALAPEAEAVGSYGDWCANLVPCARQQALLCTHDATLYSFAVLGVRRAELRHIGSLFLDHLRVNLTAEALPPPLVDQVVAAYQRLTITRTDNRSVIGSMNNLALMLEGYVQDADVRRGDDMRGLNRQLNRTPHQPLGWKYAIEALRERWLGAYAVPGQPREQVFLN